MVQRSHILQEIKNEKKHKKKEAAEDEKRHAQGEEGDDEGHKVEDSTNNNDNINSFLVEGEDSLLALEIAASLLKKDRMDARQLGMETLCLLTDPVKAGIDTALLASKVVLFGAVDAGNENDAEDEYMPPEDLGVREAILSLVQFGRLGEYVDFQEEEDVCASSNNLNAEENEFNAMLHNLALAVLANALDVLEQHGNEMAAVGSSGNSATAVAKVGEPTTNANVFLEESQEISRRELLKTLLNVLGNANSKPHDACLSAKCLRSLFQASKKAKRKARDLNAKQIVNTALDIGRRTHVKLENATRNVIRELEKTDDLNDNGDNNTIQESKSDEDRE